MHNGILVPPVFGVSSKSPLSTKSSTALLGLGQASRLHLIHSSSLSVEASVVDSEYEQEGCMMIRVRISSQF